MSEQKTIKLTPDQKRRALVALCFGSILFGFVLLEIAARVMGYRAYSVPSNNLKSISPKGPYFHKHEGLGYTHKSGVFDVTLITDYEFTTTHDPNGFRVTSETPESHIGKPEIWMMGCSFTHGWSLQDNQTFPWLLQTEFADHRIRNMGISGYGTFQSRLLFQEMLKTEAKPKLVVYVYGKFHHFRNTFPRRHRKAQAPHNRMGPLSLPYARFDESGELEYYETPLAYNPWPLMNVSAGVHMLESIYNTKDSRSHQADQVAAELVRRWAVFCKEQGIEFVVAGISSDSQVMLDFCKDIGIKNVFIAVPLSEDIHRNVPHDSHPSPLANTIYAERLTEFLEPLLEEVEQ